MSRPSYAAGPRLSRLLCAAFYSWSLIGAPVAAQAQSVKIASPSDGQPVTGTVNVSFDVASPAPAATLATITVTSVDAIPASAHDAEYALPPGNYPVTPRTVSWKNVVLRSQDPTRPAVLVNTGDPNDDADAGADHVKLEGGTGLFSVHAGYDFTLRDLKFNVHARREIVDVSGGSVRLERLEQNQGNLFWGHGGKSVVVKDCFSAGRPSRYYMCNFDNPLQYLSVDNSGIPTKWIQQGTIEAAIRVMQVANAYFKGLHVRGSSLKQPVQDREGGSHVWRDCVVTWGATPEAGKQAVDIGYMAVANPPAGWTPGNLALSYWENSTFDGYHPTGLGQYHFEFKNVVIGGAAVAARNGGTTGLSRPAAPGAAAAAASGTGAIRVSWSDNSNNEVDFIVERLIGGQWTRIAAAPVGSTAYTDSGLASGSYSYRVKAVNPAGDSAYTATVSASVAGSGATAPAITSQPAGVSVTAPQGAAFSASASGSPAPTFQWYRDGQPIAGATAAAYSLSVTAASDNGATFYVKAVNSAGQATSNAATLTVLAPPPPAPSGPALAAHLRFDEASGTALLDSSGNGNAGSLPATAAAARGAGYAGGGLEYTAAQSAVLPNSATLGGLTSYTYSAWIYPTSWGGANKARVLSRESAGLDDDFLYIEGSSATLAFNAGNMTYNAVGRGNAIRLNAWQHVAVTFDSAARAARLYVDGRELTPYLATLPASSSIAAPSQRALTIGNRPALDRAFAGRLDEVRVYRGILSTAAVAALAAQQPPAAGLGVARVMLVNTAASADLRELAQGATINLAVDGSQLAFRVDTSSPAGSVRIVLDGAARMENFAPYSACGDSGGALLPCALGVGAHALSATPYSGADASGTAGAAFARSFTVVNQPSASAPSITQSPASLSVTAGQPAAFSVSAAGTAPLSYRWQKNGVDIAGASAASYSIAAAASGDAGAYRCVVSNAAGSATSAAATLTVTSVPNPTPAGIYGDGAVDDYCKDVQPLTRQWPKDAQGWTVLPDPTTIGGRAIYVSAGNTVSDDAARGVYYRKTVSDGVALLRQGFPDALYFKRGETFNLGAGLPTGQLSGAAFEKPKVIGAYGSGARPVLRMAAGVGLINEFRGTDLIRHLAVVGLVVEANRANGATADGIRLVGGGSNLLVEDTQFRLFRNNLSLDTQQFENIIVRRSQLLDAYSTDGSHSQGIYASRVRGLLIEENVLDHNGFLDRETGVGQATIYNHNMYLQSTNRCLVTRGNISSRASSHGLQSRAGGVVEDNLMLEDPIGMSWGGVLGASVDSKHLEPGVTGRLARNTLWYGADIQTDLQREGQMEVGNMLRGQIVDNLFGHHIRSGAGAGLTLASSNAAGIHNLRVERNSFYALKTAFKAYGDAYGPVTIRNDGVDTAWCEKNRPTTNVVHEGTGDVVLRWLGTTADAACATGEHRFQEFSGGDVFDAAGRKVVDSRISGLYAPRGSATISIADSGTTFSGNAQGSISTLVSGTTSITSKFAADVAARSFSSTAGLPGGNDAFISRARQQSRGNWDPAYTGAVQSARLRAALSPQ